MCCLQLLQYILWPFSYLEGSLSSLGRPHSSRSCPTHKINRKIPLRFSLKMVHSDFPSRQAAQPQLHVWSSWVGAMKLPLQQGYIPYHVGTNGHVALSLQMLHPQKDQPHMINHSKTLPKLIFDAVGIYWISIILHDLSWEHINQFWSIDPISPTGNRPKKWSHSCLGWWANWGYL